MIADARCEGFLGSINLIARLFFGTYLTSLRPAGSQRRGMASPRPALQSGFGLSPSIGSVASERSRWPGHPGLESQNGQQHVVPLAGKVGKIGSAQLLSNAARNRFVEVFVEGYGA